MIFKTCCTAPRTSLVILLICFSTATPKLSFSQASSSGEAPAISIVGTSAAEVHKYEKFELSLELQHVKIDNPYDPDDIDVYARFTAPSGKVIRINGFYDDHMDAAQWKLRFSPAEVGNYSYQLFVEDEGGTGQSEVTGFTCLDSEHHGWIRPSTVNPRYFAHDDGSTWYGVGAYSPWRNNMERFDNYAGHEANFFAIWDITYGGFVNGTGLIEEELGRYNQLKCHRIDSMLYILEERGIQMMYAIWPHDLFSETVWAAQWKRNPYSQLVDADEVYSDPEVWEYQKKKYRYMIARFGHSRSLGIWELINEMNGTDAWAHGRHEDCYAWVEKCQQYFSEHDPYRHPVTASFSGGFEEYREELHHLIDIPNIHLYPAQGWELKYPDDSLRSAMHNYAWASRRFWDSFEKPAIFGESGADLAYFQVEDANYHVSYHNQIWASLSNGLAATPVWWAYNHLTPEDWDQLMYLSRFVSDIDFANQPFEPLRVSAEGTDLYAMGSGREAFGWCRTYEKTDISGTSLILLGLDDHSYTVSWYDTWKGEILATETLASRKGKLRLKVPETPGAPPDIAFKIAKLIL
jgi:hypothetical protein